MRQRCTPPWADRDQIKRIYALSVWLTSKTGIPYEVDHVIPVNHPRVCGLNIPANLQILTKEANLKKGNHFDA